MENFVEYCKKREGYLVDGVLDGEDLIDFDRAQEYLTTYLKNNLTKITNAWIEDADIVNGFDGQGRYTEVWVLKEECEKNKGR